MDLHGLPDIVSKGLSIQCTRDQSDFLATLPSRLCYIFDLAKSFSWSSLGHLEFALYFVAREIASMELLDASTSLLSTDLLTLKRPLL